MQNVKYGLQHSMTPRFYEVGIGLVALCSQCIEAL